MEDYLIGKDPNLHLLDYLTNPTVFNTKMDSSPLPSGSGLAIDINEEVVRESAKIVQSRKNQLWHNEDGTIAEW